MRRMPSQNKKKNIQRDSFGNTVDSPTLDFIIEFKKWEKQLKGISAKQIQSEGRENKDGSRKAVPKTLYGQLRQHVTAAFRRPNSVNAGDKGAYKLLDKITKAIKTRTVFTEEDLDDLKEFQDDLTVFEQAEGKLNPRNTLFTTPKTFDVVDGEVVPSEGTKPLYGHYVDKFFVKKYPKKGYKVKTKWSNSSMNTANPPLAQALFAGPKSQSDLGIEKGLIQIVDDAIEELESEKINLYTIGIKRAGALARLPSVKKWVNAAIRNKRFYPENSGKINLRAIGNALLAQTFPIKSETEQKVLMIAATNKQVNYAQDILNFKVGQITPAVMTSLIREVISRGSQEHIKVRNGYYLQLRGLSDPPSETHKDIKKSWIEMLWA